MVFGARARQDAWECLRDDDGVGLVRALACHGVRTREALDGLKDDMWREGRGRGVGVFCIAATNDRGLPDVGAPRCLRALLERYGADSWAHNERAWTSRRVAKMGRRRVEAVMRECDAWVERE